jgi:N6-L-threonylcarbamoyladenine synthase
MAYALKKPLVPVNHIEGHIFSAFIEQPEVAYPVLALVVSGGHTSLIFSPEPLRYRSMARTRDDAAGEALDKLSKFLGLGYPGGPIIDRLAPLGDPRAFSFSIPKISDGSLDFSFSGFKTAALRHIREHEIAPRKRPGGRVSRKMLDLLASYQHAIVDSLVRQTSRAAERLRPRSILLVGGVACNSLLRSTFTKVFEGRTPDSSGTGEDPGEGVNLASEGVRVYYPRPSLTTDNAAMIAAAGTPKFGGAGSPQLDLNAEADLRLC